MPIYEEDDYLRALAEFSNLESKTWLLQYFVLYKSTLNWPEGLPPISRSNLMSCTFRANFNSTYYETLAEFNHVLDYEKQTLVFF
jgi:hypothetical protein